jgi:hypothetical protein
MTSHTSVSGEDVLRDPRDFSLVLGGPLFQLLRRSHLTDDALALLCQRIIVIALLAWLPLLVLSALEGQALRGGADHAPRAYHEGGHPPARSRDTCAGCAAGTHRDAAGRTAEKAVRHLVLGNLQERMHDDIPLRLYSPIEL